MASTFHHGTELVETGNAEAAAAAQAWLALIASTPLPPPDFGGIDLMLDETTDGLQGH